MDKNVKHYPLAQTVEMPQHCAYVVRDLPQATVEQRERALNATHWNEFSFPSGLLTVDMLSDSGTTAMTNQQWATMMLGDEAYGRNTGYYVLLDTFRDIFERGGEKNWKKSIDLVRTDCRDLEKMMDELFLCEYEGGLFNGGAAQMERPNAFIIQQGRAADGPLVQSGAVYPRPQPLPPQLGEDLRCGDRLVALHFDGEHKLREDAYRRQGKGQPHQQGIAPPEPAQKKGHAGLFRRHHGTQHLVPQRPGRAEHNAPLGAEVEKPLRKGPGHLQPDAPPQGVDHPLQHASAPPIPAPRP